MSTLDSLLGAYGPETSFYLENNLILNWYPQRIINRTSWARSLLELGLGHGFAANRFGALFAKHVVVEGSRLIIDQYLRAHPPPQFMIVESLFEVFDTQDKFDAIVMGFVLEHVDDPREILVRYRNFLSPGGKLYVTAPNGKCLNRRLGFELGIINDLYGLNDNDRAHGHKRQYCLDRLREEVEQAGYEITCQEGIYLKPLPLAILKHLDRFDENLQAMLKVGIEYPELSVAILLEAVPK